MKINQYLLTGFLCWCVLLNVQAQNANNGQITIMPGTIATAVDEFINNSTGTVNNDGEFFMYSHLQNNGEYGFTVLSEGKSFTYFNSKLQPQNISGKNISYFNNIVFDNAVQKYAFKLDGEISVSSDAFFKKGVVVGTGNHSNVIFEKGAFPINTSDQSHVQGYVKTKDSNLFIYPVGDGGYHRYAKLDPVSNNSSYRVKYYFQPVANLTPNYSLAPNLEVIDNAEVWEIQGLSNNSSAKLTLSWKEVTTPAFILGQASPKMVIVHFDESKNQWVSIEGTSNATIQEITSNNHLSQTGLFTLGLVTTINTLTNLSLTKSSLGRRVNVGDTFIYEIVVQNNSDVDAANVVIVDNLPFNLFFDKVEYESIFGNDKIKHTVLGNTITWTVPLLIAKDQLTIKLYVKAVDPALTINVANVTTETAESNFEDNTDSDELLINRLFVPNVFTPNGDGQNDLFVIEGIEGYNRVELEISNRWGDQVYKSLNYKNNWNGLGLPEGTYFYFIKTISDFGNREYKGWVQLMREKTD